MFPHAAVSFLLVALLTTTTFAQTIRQPSRPPLGTGLPSGSAPGGITGLPGGSTSAPDLRGTLGSVPSAPNVQKEQTMAVPPRAAGTAAPDTGGTSECACYRVDTVMIRNRDGSLTQQRHRRLDGTKSLACCPKRR